jgi:hypothetical protein
MRSLFISICLVLIAAPVSAQECDTSKQSLSMPNERYFDNGDGTIVDLQNGAIWMRCALGQEWDGETCQGEATLYTWSEVETLADDVNLDGYAGHDDWRVPNLPELATITERACKNPRINAAVFPGTPLLSFWTTMKKPASELIYAMNFGEKGLEMVEKEHRGPVRMIRGERFWFPPSVREMMKEEDGK